MCKWHNVWSCYGTCEPPSKKSSFWQLVTHQCFPPNTHRGAGTRKSSASRPRGEKKGPEGKLEWQAIAKKLVPEGRASYALWFTTCNIALIIGVFAYMAGDYAQWVRENPTELDNAEFTTVCPPPLCML